MSSKPMAYSILPSSSRLAARRRYMSSASASSDALRICVAAWGVMVIMFVVPCWKGRSCIRCHPAGVLRGPVTPDELDKSGSPVVVVDVAHVRVAGQYVAVHDAIVPAIDAGAAGHVVGVYKIAGPVLKCRIMEFMGANINRGGPGARPGRLGGVARFHVAASVRTLV